MASPVVPFQTKKKSPAATPDPPWIEGAGALLLLAAAQESGLVATLTTALTTLTLPAPLPRAPQRQCQALLTLLFLPAVGLRRLWDLRAYMGSALALLTARPRAYGYRHSERWLAGLAMAGADPVVTEAVATWAARVWHGSTWDPAAPLYVDGHKKPVYSDRCLPRGLIGRRGVILGCRSLTFVHDPAGHPLVALTQRGDTHLTRSVPALVAQFERSTALPIGHLVIDREGMAADFLATLAEEGRTVTTLLRANQYRDLGSFTDIGAWTPLLTDATGTVLREVAPAQYTLVRATAAEGQMDLSVALIRDHRWRVPILADAPAWDAWDADLPPEVRLGKAPAHPLPPAPAIPTAAKLIPLVSTSSALAPTDLVDIYRRRWVAQENSFKDWLIPLGLDINHGYHATAVVNSEVSRRRVALEARIATLDRWATKAEERERRASARHLKWVGMERTHTKAGYRTLRTALMDLRDQGVAEEAYQATHTRLWAAYEATCAAHRAAIIHAYHQSNQEYGKYTRYRSTQRQLLRDLEQLATTERQMYELDNRKDQVMTMLKVALVNLGMWMRDQWFPADYAHATWRRLEPFMRLTGRVHRHRDRVVLELRPFNDAALRRDLVTLCARVTTAAPQLPDGRRLELMVGAGMRRCATA